MNTPIPPETLSAIKEDIFNGRKISAIKLHRQATNLGLKEAKDAIEKIEAELRAASPEKFIAAPARKGCFAIIACVAILAAAFIAMMLI